MADYHSNRKEGAKNHSGVSTRCWSHYIATYNIRPLLSEDMLVELEEELRNVKWHIIGLSETRRQGECIKQLSSGHVLYTVGKDDKSEGGVGFLVNRELTNNIVQYSNASDRVAMVVVILSDRYSVKILQVYAPTTRR